MDASPPTLSRALRNASLFLLAAAVTTLVLKRLLPVDVGKLLRAKLDVFTEQDREEPFDVVFLGSSRTYHGIVPEVFESVLRERGHELRAFNLGLTGQKIDGAYSTLKRLAAARPRGLKYVFVDPENAQLMLEPQRRQMRGVVYWHDPRSVQMLLRYVWNDPTLRPEDRLERTAEILGAGAYELANVGRGLPWVDELLERDMTPENRAYRIGPRRDGFRAKDDTTGQGAIKAHAHFLKFRRRWEQELTAFREADPTWEPLSLHALPLFERIRDAVRDLGAEPIFLIGPSTSLQGQLVNAHEQGHVETLFRYNDVHEYPELFEVDSRWEQAHLNRRGATLYTTHVANDFADWLEAREEEP